MSQIEGQILTLPRIVIELDLPKLEPNNENQPMVTAVSDPPWESFQKDLNQLIDTKYRGRIKASVE